MLPQPVEKIPSSETVKGVVVDIFSNIKFTKVSQRVISFYKIICAHTDECKHVRTRIRTLTNKCAHTEECKQVRTHAHTDDECKQVCTH